MRQLFCFSKIFKKKEIVDKEQLSDEEQDEHLIIRDKSMPRSRLGSIMNTTPQPLIGRRSRKVSYREPIVGEKSTGLSGNGAETKTPKKEKEGTFTFEYINSMLNRFYLKSSDYALDLDLKHNVGVNLEVNAYEK
jgi:hypothetical protein